MALNRFVTSSEPVITSLPVVTGSVSDYSLPVVTGSIRASDVITSYTLSDCTTLCGRGQHGLASVLSLAM